MVEDTRAPYTPPRRRFKMRELARVATWGLAAMGALTLAAYAASSPTGEDRLILAVASIRGVPPPDRLARSPAETEARQLAAAVRGLSTDREQLMARIDTLERSITEVTGSIARAASTPPPTPAPAPVPANLPPTIAVPEVVQSPPATAATPETPPPVRAATPAPASDEPASAPVAPKSEFGIDLGRASSVEGLRQIWATVRSRHGSSLEGLRPIMALREIPRGGGVELRLVAGPLPNAAAAARTCAMLPGTVCHPTLFEGQRLALR